MNDVVINKIKSIQRCVLRAREEYKADPDGFANNYTRQDAALLNVVRACDTAIDMANHAIRVRKLGIPVSSADSFELLQVEKIIDLPLAERMKKMVGFRNTIVHQYTAIDLAIVASVIASDLEELLGFAEKIRKLTNDSAS